MSILRIEPFSGVSGDLFVGALAQLANAEALVSELPGVLGFEHVRTVWETVDKCGVSCRKVSFVDEENHAHEHHHPEGHSHSHGHRHLSEIQEIIRKADLSSSARDRALDIFQRLGEAEAHVHGISIQKVHFHEVGAVDSIMDIVASAVLLDRLGVVSSYSDPVVTGKGMVKMAHGRYPIPAPATYKLLEGMVTEPGAESGEMTTPTGAAILQHLKPSFEVPQLRVLSSAVAGATKEFSHPNILRLSLCSDVKKSANELLLIQTNIDDMSGELLGQDLLDLLLEKGAKDAWLNPIIMKKGRPAFKLEVLCSSDMKDELASIVLENTSTIGVRFLPVTRRELERELVEVDTEFGEITVKSVVLPSGDIRRMPEYSDCARIAKETGNSVQKIYRSALQGKLK